MKGLELEINDYLQYEILVYYYGYYKGWNNIEVGYINIFKNDEGIFSNN